MRYRIKDIGDAGLEVQVPVTAAGLSTECPGIDVEPKEPCTIRISPASLLHRRCLETGDQPIGQRIGAPDIVPADQGEG